jgi:hypothetical protein
MTNVVTASKGNRRGPAWSTDVIDIRGLKLKLVLSGLACNAINKSVPPHKDCPEASSFLDPEQAGACLNRVLKLGYGHIRTLFAPSIHFAKGLPMEIIISIDGFLIANGYNRLYDNTACFVIKKVRKGDLSFMERPFTSYYVT